MPLHDRLRKLETVWIEPAIYFITTCVAGRRRVLGNAEVLATFRREFESAPARHGWTVGSFVIMPDHLHFLRAAGGTPEDVTLSRFLQAFKQWTAKEILVANHLSAPFWQPGFFDHVLRSGEKYDEAHRYMTENPVRAGLVARSEDWPYQGIVSPLTR